MPLPKEMRDKVEQRLAQYCQERVPEHLRDRVRATYKIRGGYVTLTEQRLVYLQPATWVDIPVAQFRFRPADETWMLYWPDRNTRWHEYYDVDRTEDLEDLLREVDEDPTGIFWG